MKEEKEKEKTDKVGPCFPASLPTIDVFKIAHLNKSFRNRVTEIFEMTLKDLSLFKTYDSFIKAINMFNTPPSWDKFHQLSLRQTVVQSGNKMSYTFRDENELAPYLISYQ